MPPPLYNIFFFTMNSPLVKPLTNQRENIRFQQWEYAQFPFLAFVGKKSNCSVLCKTTYYSNHFYRRPDLVTSSEAGKREVPNTNLNTQCIQALLHIAGLSNIGDPAPHPSGHYLPLLNIGPNLRLNMIAFLSIDSSVLYS